MITRLHAIEFVLRTERYVDTLNRFNNSFCLPFFSPYANIIREFLLSFRFCIGFTTDFFGMISAIFIPYRIVGFDNLNMSLCVIVCFFVLCHLVHSQFQ